MSSKASTTAIGGFVIGAAILFLGSLVYFGSGKFGTEVVSCVMYFDGSLKGLKVGAPVLFRGVRIGEVTRVVVRYQSNDHSTSIPVFADLFPDTVEHVDERPRDPIREMNELIEKGLRAKLEMQSMVTGTLTISLALYEEAAPADLHHTDKKMLEIPTLPSMMEELTKTLEHLPIDEIATDLQHAIQGIDELVRSERVANAIDSLDTTLKDFSKLANDLDLEIKPTTQKLNEALQEATDVLKLAKEKIPTITDRINPMLEEFTLVGKNVNKNIDPLMSKIDDVSDSVTVALKQATKTLKRAGDLADPDGEMYFEIVAAIRELKAAARSIRTLADYMEQHPEALLQGKKAPGGF